MAERDLVARLHREGLAPGSWSNSPGDTYGAHHHDYDKVLVCAEGSITFGLPTAGDRVTLTPGDRLDLPAGTRHDAVVGPLGVSCLESHLPAGRLAAAPRRRAAGEW